MLSQLNEHYAPGDKAVVLVEAHKVIVGGLFFSLKMHIPIFIPPDGLSRLPPIRLMTEEESKALREKSATAFAVVLDKVEEAPAPVETGPGETSAVAQDGNLPIPRIVVQPGSEEEEASSPPPANVDQDEAAHEKDEECPTIPPPWTPTPVSTDILLPLLIFSVVKANPAHLVSHLLFSQRFRNSSPTFDRHSHLLAVPDGGGVVGRGEERFCVVNLMGVAQFLESVDFDALGLGGERERERVVKELGVGAVGVGVGVGVGNVTPLTPIAGGTGLGLGVLRGRVEQATMGVLNGVVGTGVGVLRALLPGGHGSVAAGVAVGTTLDGPATTENGAPGGGGTPVSAAVEGSAGGGFSLRSITAALPVPIPRVGRGRGGGEEEGQQLLPVGSSGLVGEDAEPGFMDEGEDGEGEGDEEEDEDGDDGASDAASLTVGSDPRGIRSFESMLGGNVRGKRKGRGGQRKSLSDRLARISSLAALKVCFYATIPRRDAQSFFFFFFFIFCRNPSRHRVSSLCRFRQKRCRCRRRLLVLLHRKARRRLCNRGHRVSRSFVLHPLSSGS